MRRELRAVLAFALVAAAACEPWYNRVPSPDDLMHVVPWFDHMIGQRSIHPYETGAVPRNSVPGTVPINGAEGDWSAEFRAGVATTADRLVNPYAAGGSDSAPLPGPAVPLLAGTIEAKGDTLYGFYCAVCHGSAGDGKGPVGPRVGALSLLTERARGFSDGYLYSIIRYGRGVMPRYGDKVYRPADRWAIVNHLRAMQAAAPVPPPAPGTAPSTPASTPPTPAASRVTGGTPR